MERNKKIKYISYLKEWKIEDEIKMTKPTETEEDDGRKIFTDGSVWQDGENLESENIADKQKMIYSFLDAYDITCFIFYFVTE